MLINSRKLLGARKVQIMYRENFHFCSKTFNSHRAYNILGKLISNWLWVIFTPKVKGQGPMGLNVKSWDLLFLDKAIPCKVSPWHIDLDTLDNCRDTLEDILHPFSQTDYCVFHVYSMYDLILPVRSEQFHNLCVGAFAYAANCGVTHEYTQ